jgi:hypothetical protein
MKSHVPAHLRDGFRHAQARILDESTLVLDGLIGEVGAKLGDISDLHGGPSPFMI